MQMQMQEEIISTAQKFLVAYKKMKKVKIGYVSYMVGHMLLIQLIKLYYCHELLNILA
jgi:hypothetical protein